MKFREQHVAGFVVGGGEVRMRFRHLRFEGALGKQAIPVRCGRNGREAWFFCPEPGLQDQSIQADDIMGR
jgi:hypothetical protein